MRLWTLHPRYLDSKGLVSAWREGLLAKKVLKGKTIGYRNHPQLVRFRESQYPIEFINTYLDNLLIESQQRGYSFNKDKINKAEILNGHKIEVTKGQIEYEYMLLSEKLKKRDQDAYMRIKRIKCIEVNGIFKITEGTIAGWEKVKKEVLS